MRNAARGVGKDEKGNFCVAIDISELRPEDYEPLAALWQSAEEFGPIPFKSQNALAGFLRENRGLSVAAREDGRVLGVVLCQRIGMKGCANRLAVGPEHTDTDLQHELLSKALRKIIAAGIHRFWIQMSSAKPGETIWNSVKWTNPPVLSAGEEKGSDEERVAANKVMSNE